MALEPLEDRCLLSTGLWTQRGGDAGHTSYADTDFNPAVLTQTWDAPLTYAQTGGGTSHEQAVAIDERHVYRTHQEGYTFAGPYHVIAFDLHTGNPVWKRTIESHAHAGVGEPSVAGGIVYVNRAGHSGAPADDSERPRILGFDARTGATVLEQRYSAQWGSNERPVVADNQLVAEAGYYGGVSVYDVSTLSEQWHRQGSQYYQPAAAVDDDYVYAYDNLVYDRTTGASRPAIIGPAGMSTVRNPMVSGSGRIVFDVRNAGGTTKFGVAAYDGDTHQLLWVANTPTAASAKAVGGGVVAVAAGRQLILLNEADGTPIRTWQAPADLTAEIVLTRTHVFVQSAVAYGPAKVHAIRLATGQEVWSYENKTADEQLSTVMEMALGSGYLVLSHRSFVRGFAFVGRDFGDAPDTYGTALANNGAIHVMGGPHLGAFTDGENNGQPHAFAQGDDATELDDDDGVFAANLIAGGTTTFTINVTGVPGKLDAWVDFNRNGVFEEGSERTTAPGGTQMFVGANQLAVSTPANTSFGLTYARFRLSSAGGLAPSGAAADGEVEDHPLHIYAASKIAFESEGETRLMNPDGTGERTLGKAGGHGPSWSPDGQYLAVMNHGQRPGVYIISAADGSQQSYLGISNMPAWSPDGSKIAFVLGETGSDSAIYVINPDGTGRTRLTHSTEHDQDPAWSPDGRKIAFTRYQEGQIYVMNADGTGQTKFIAGWAPAWSPDGSRIVFVNSNDIHVINVDGSGRTRLTFDPAIDLEPSWSPDGNKIIFTSWRDSTRQLYVMNPDGSGQTRITLSADGSYEAAWGGIVPQFDMGDAPDSYGTTYAANGATHHVAGPRLGNLVDEEDNGRPHFFAQGDDALQTDDEDGVAVSNLLLGRTTTLGVHVANEPGRLDAWIDFNQNGVFDSSERITAPGGTPVVIGANLLSVTPPSDASLGLTYARFRISKAGGLGPTGFAADGEVEDHSLYVYAGEGQWTQRGGNAGHTAFVDTGFDPSFLSQAWKQSVGPAQPGLGAIAIDDTRLYRTQTAEGGMFGTYHVLAFDLKTGNQVWQRTLQGNAHAGTGEPSVANGIVYVNSAGHSGISGGNESQFPRLYGFDAQTGATVIQRIYSDQWGSNDRPVIEGHQLIAEAGYYGGVSSYDRSTLAEQWHQGGEQNDRPLAAIDDEYVYAYGSQVFDRITGTRLPYFTGPIGLSMLTDPMVSDSGRVFLEVNRADYESNSFGLAAYDGDTHQLIWVARTPGPVRAKAVGNGIVAVTAGRQLILLNEADGTQIRSWQAPADLNDEIVLMRTHVFVQSSLSFGPTRVHAISLATGQQVWTFENPYDSQSPAMQMAMGGGYFFLSSSSFIRAFHITAPDFGDAPATYGTTLTDNGARHVISGPRLGSLIDEDANGQPHAFAQGDDGNAADDDDGVFGANLVRGQTTTFTINVAGARGKLDAWIDFNRNGRFDVTERITLPGGTPMMEGANTLAVAPPSDTEFGLTYARFRLSTQGGLAPTGSAVDGEVEDYPLFVYATTKIAFTSLRDGDSEIYVMNADGTEQRVLTDNLAIDASPAWSPDGSRIVFSSNRDGDSEIFVMNADGTRPVQLTHNADPDASPHWSPDGSKIAFVSRRDGANEIYVMNVDGGQQTRLTGTFQNTSEPVWSPDGRKIAFVATATSGQIDIYVMNADGSNLVNLTNDSWFESGPSWSADGARIAYGYATGAVNDIYVMNADGTGKSPLIETQLIDSQPAFSPNSGEFAFTTPTNNQFEIFVASPDGSRRTQLTIGGGGFATWGGIVVNTAPTIAALSGDWLPEGAVYVLRLGNVVNFKTVTSYRINWGDGTSTTGVGDPSGRTVMHVYKDEGNYAVTIDLTDEHGTHLASGSKNIRVENEATFLTGSVSDSLVVDRNGNGVADAGDVIEYTATVTNNGPDSATSVLYTPQLDPNMTLVAPASGGTSDVVVFTDNFDGGLEAWMQNAPGFGVAGGRMVGASGHLVNLATIAASQADVRLEAQYDLRWSTTFNHFGLVARHQGTAGDSNMYAGIVYGSPGSFTAGIWRNIGGSWRELASAPTNAVAGALRFEAIGGALRLLVNDVLVATTFDVTFSGGRSGVRLGTGIFADSFNVTRLGSRVFEDDFQRGPSADAGPAYVEGAAEGMVGDFSVENGRLVGVGGFVNIAVAASSALADVSVKADVNLSGNGFEHAGVVARYQGTGDNNMYAGLIYGVGGEYSSLLWKNVNGVASVLDNRPVSGPAGNLRLDVIGAALKLYFNEALVGEAMDSAISRPGLAGVRSSNQAIDNLSIAPLALPTSAVQNLGTLPAGESKRAVYRAVVNNPLPANVTRVAHQGSVNGTDSGTGITYSPVSTNIMSRTVEAAPEMRITISGPAEVQIADDIVYTIDFSNLGTQAATGVRVVVRFPIDMSLRGGNVDGQAAAWTSGDGQTFELFVGEVKARSAKRLALVVKPATPHQVTQEMTVRATVTDDGSQGTDPDLFNNTRQHSMLLRAR